MSIKSSYPRLEQTGTREEHNKKQKYIIYIHGEFYLISVLSSSSSLVCLLKSGHDHWSHAICLAGGGEGDGLFTGLSDAITNALLMARSILTTPLSWISALVVKSWNVAMIIVTTPVQWLISLASWLITCVQLPFIWIFAESHQENMVSFVHGYINRIVLSTKTYK